MGITVLGVKGACHKGEKGIVELYNSPQAAPVLLKRMGVIGIREIRLHSAGKKMPVAATPTVNTLFNISNNKVGAACSLAFLQKQFLINKRSVASRNDIAQSKVGLVKTYYILLFKKRLELTLQFHCKSKRIYL